MNKPLLYIGIIWTLLESISLAAPKSNQISTGIQNNSNPADRSSDKIDSTVEQRKAISNFLPEGYVIYEKISGDLNKDGLEDYIIIIKGPDKSKFIKNENRGELDLNRRGLLVLFNHKDHLELAVKNYNCFSSENEDGGVYYAPELSVSTKKGNLYIHYSHGRYGYWKYTFRFKYSDFELIGYDANRSSGPVTDEEISINFLTKRKLVKVNVNKDAESGEEIFKETWKDITIKTRLKLSEIKDFDEIDMSY
jgi:hypothetical protein